MNSRTCNWCGDEIPYWGATSSHYGRLKREDSRFCCDKCKIDYHNAKRKLKRKKTALRKLHFEVLELEKKFAWDQLPLVEADKEESKLGINLDDFTYEKTAPKLFHKGG